ncbi:hypothetical protein EOL94_02020 [bacterium]|nr:hypothetical protein [bacterium]
MKKVLVFLFVVSLFSFSTLFVNGQSVEPMFSGGVGYMTDPGGDGSYQYTSIGLGSKKDNSIFGGFVGFTNVGVCFGGYTFTAQEYTVGVNLVGWGSFSEKHSYAFWLMPGVKYFDDYGHNLDYTEEAWQNDVGVYAIAGANLTDKENRWFRNYKLQMQYQDNYWSDRKGVWHDENNIVDSINYKAVNKSYFKTQFEVAAKRFYLGKKGRLEPKLVLGYLYDGGASSSYYEFGTGVAISFMKEGRYFEPFNIQYRARYGKEFVNRLDLFEVNFDLVSIFRLMKN